MATKDRNLRVLMFPWLGYGHISPFLELAKKLSKKNFYIYFCSTPINLNAIKNRVSSSDLLSIELLEFHLPSSQELPPHHHTTNGLPPHLFPILAHTYSSTAPSCFHDFFISLKPDVVIYDLFQPWIPEIAASNHIPAVHFLCSAAVSSYFYFMQKNNDLGMPFPSSKICYKPAETKKMFEAVPQLVYHGGGHPIYTCLDQSSEIVLIKSCRDIEDKYINFYSLLTKKKFVPVGLLTRVADHEQEKNGGEDNSEIMQWLDSKEKCSTVFVSFGSETFLSKKEREELAYGLELSDVNFVWAFRFPVAENVKIEKALPQGFLERVKGRGIVVEGWVPQAKILGHGSIGGFVSHCGWGSVSESLSFGVPIIGIPMNFDQPLNARFAVEIGVGLEIMKDENLEFGGEEVARVIKEVVMEKSGEDFRRKVREFSEKIRLKEEEVMCEAVEELKKLCNGFGLCSIRSYRCLLLS